MRFATKTGQAYDTAFERVEGTVKPTEVITTHFYLE